MQLKKDFGAILADTASTPISILPMGYFPASNLHCLLRRFSMLKNARRAMSADLIRQARKACPDSLARPHA